MIYLWVEMDSVASSDILMLKEIFKLVKYLLTPKTYCQLINGSQMLFLHSHNSLKQKIKNEFMAITVCHK